MKKERNQNIKLESARFFGYMCYYSVIAILAVQIGGGDKVYFTDMSTCLLLLPVVLVYAGIIVLALLGKRKKNELVETKFADRNRMLCEMTENIARDYESQKRRLVRLKRASEFITYFLLAFPVAFNASCAFTHDMRAWLIGFLPCFFLFCSGCFHVEEKENKKDRTFSGETLKRGEYPVLYEIADKAAGAVGISKKFTLVPIPGDNVGISRFKDEDCVLIGSTILQLLSYDELHAILLHEFAHSEVDADGKILSLYRHSNFIMNCEGNHFLMIPYLYFDLSFIYEKTVFDTVSSVYTEQHADLAMRSGNTAAAGSMLVKLEYLNLYDWEYNCSDSVSLYREETPPPYTSVPVIDKIREAIKTRSGFWNEIIGKEIQSRNASHPITRSRLESLGIKEIKTPEFTADSGEFAEEKLKFLSLVDSLTDKQLRENDYAKAREEYYLKPLKLIEEWEAGGCQLTPAGYRTVTVALSELGRASEAISVYERAIAEFSDVGAAYAHYSYGNYLIRKFDRRGIDHLWKAIDTNVNYTEAGLEAIAIYACLTGDSELLETYRSRAEIAGQNEMDYEDALATMDKKDSFTEEHLPDGQLEKDIAEMLEIGGDNIEKIWLVRKTVCGHFRSQYVVKLTDGTADDETERIITGIFNYLDTVSDWNYGLFYYENVKDTKFYRTEGSLVYEK